LRRLERLRRKQKGKRKTHYLFPLPGESAGAQIKSLIASGEARATDEFIIICWDRRMAREHRAQTGAPFDPRCLFPPCIYRDRCV
jgi:hypothetical protein